MTAISIRSPLLFTVRSACRRAAALFTAFALLSLNACGAQQGPVIDTPQGSVRGIVEEGVHVFYNLPYARPPVGPLRWTYPQPPEDWTELREAYQEGAICEQPTGDGVGNNAFVTALAEGAGMSDTAQWALRNLARFSPAPRMSEDCLTLTVRTPDLSGRLPVMVWIHGGGHRFGSGNQGFAQSNALPLRGVVQVSINYRLGIWGHFAHPELVEEDANGSAGNYGLLDQIQALRWVQENILAYGGDPEKVTLFGESAGAHSVGQIIASPLSRGLLHGAIAQSGIGTWQFQHLRHTVESVAGIEAGIAFARLAGITGTEQLPRLRALTVEQIRALEQQDPTLAATYHPQVDGWALPATTAERFEQGLQLPVPVILGSNADEATVLGQMIPSSIDGVTEAAPATADAWDAYLGRHAPALRSEYAADTDANVAEQHYRLLGDSLFGRHAYASALLLARRAPTYLYLYERTPASPTQTIGASHALELQHVFNRFMPLWPTDQRDDELAAEMGAYWTNFAKRRNPNGDGLPNWPRFNPAVPEELAFGHNATSARAVSRRHIYEGLAAQQRARVARAVAAREAGSVP